MTRETFIAKVVPLRNSSFRYALSLLGSRTEAEDLAQDVLIRLWNSRDRLVGIDSIEAYVIRATRNLCLTQLDRRKRGAAEPESTLREFVAPQRTERPVEQKEAMQQLQLLLEKLPEPQRSVFHLREVEGYSYAEIASQLNLTPENARVFACRTRQRLARQLHPAHRPDNQGQY